MALPATRRACDQEVDNIRRDLRGYASAFSAPQNQCCEGVPRHALVVESESGKPAVVRLMCGRSEWMMNEWDTNESNWSAAENDLASLIDDIYAAHAPEVLNQPVTSDYENWIDDLTEKIGQV